MSAELKNNVQMVYFNHMKNPASRKKTRWLLPLLAVVFGALLLWSQAQADIPVGVSQVKTADSPAVYYVNHRLKLKKAYVNEVSYLSYGNRWSDIRTVAPADLATFSDVELVKAASSPALYYIKGKQKALIVNENDWAAFGLKNAPIITVSLTDLAQYETVSYQQIGLDQKAEQEDGQEAEAAPDLTVVLADLPSSGYFLAGSADNPVFKLIFSSQTGAEINSLSFNLKGLNSGGIISRLAAKDGQGNSYDVSSSVRNTDADLRFYRDPIVVPAGGQVTVTILATGNACSACAGQTLMFELEKAGSISANQAASGNFPLQSQRFEIVASSGSVGKAVIKEESLASLSQGGGTRTIGKFTISEREGGDSVYIKQLEFSNSGSAGRGDLEDLRLRRGGSIISRGSWESGRLVFPISYLRVDENNPATLEIIASLDGDYDPSGTVNLSFKQMTASGKDSALNLVPESYDLDETITLN